MAVVFYAANLFIYKMFDIFGINTYVSVPNIFGLSIGELFLSGAMVFYLGFLFIKSFTDIVL